MKNLISKLAELLREAAGMESDSDLNLVLGVISSLLSRMEDVIV